MNGKISILLLEYIPVCLVGLFAAHILLMRYGGQRVKRQSPQVLLVGLVLALNIPVLAGTWWIAADEGRNAAQALYMLIFSFLVFNGMGYAYFHVFNMSETARRIRILGQIRRAGPGGLRIEELEQEYSQKDMIGARLDRLVHMKQLSLGADGKYRVSGKMLLWVGKILRLWGWLVFRRAC